MLKFFLWLRYLKKKKIALLSIVAVALSVTLMISVNSLFTGYIDALGEMLFSDMGDTVIWTYRGASMNQYDKFIEKLKQHPNIETAAPYHYGGGLLYVEGADVREVMLKGIEPEYESGFRDWNKQLIRQKDSPDMPNFSVDGNAKDPGVWLGINIVAEPNEETDKYDLDQVKSFIGKKVILTTMDYKGKRHVEKFIVSDVISSKGYFDDKTVYMPLDALRKIDEKAFVDNSTNFIKLKLNNRKQSQQLATDIKDLWYKYAVEELAIEPKAVPFLNVDSRDRLYQNIFNDLRNQLTVVMLMFGVICSVAVLLIFCIFYMIVTTRQKDIAIIKSCGASSLSAASIFAGFGACIGIMGSVLGIILAVVVTNNVNILEEWVRIIFGIKLWRTSSYGLAEIPHHVHWPVVPWVVLAAIVGCVIGVLIPSIIAARTKPVEILRYE